MNLKFKTIAKIFRKIIKLNSVIIFKGTNEYNRKIISKRGRKMDLYPALNHNQTQPMTIGSDFSRHQLRQSFVYIYKALVIFIGTAGTSQLQRIW